MRDVVTVTWHTDDPAPARDAVIRAEAVAPDGTSRVVGTAPYAADGALTWMTGDGTWSDGQWHLRIVAASKRGSRVFGASTSVRVLVDNTAPVMTLVERTPPNAHGWNDGTFEIAWDCVDATSGVRNYPWHETWTEIGSGLWDVSAACNDWAGNETTATERVQVDVEPPELGPLENPSPNQYFWFNHDVTIRFQCVDEPSGPVDDIVENTLTTEGFGQSLAVVCRDLAGNETVYQRWQINLDKTAPTMTGVRRTPPNAAGWNNTAVELEAECADALSGPLPLFSINVSDDGADQAVDVRCLDRAGNETISTITGINIDTVAPDYRLVERTPTNAAGWNNDDVWLTWACTDQLSGVHAYTSSSHVWLDGEHHVVVACTDQAGNRTEDRQMVRVDRTPATADITTTSGIAVARALAGLPGGSVAGRAADVVAGASRSGVATVLAEFTDGSGVVTTVPARCVSGCGATGEITWEADVARLASGSYRVAARAVDVAGNIGVASAAIDITVV